MSLVTKDGTNKAAFRCKACGHLVDASHAGEQFVPYACPVCGGGVSWTPTGVKLFHPQNWDVLADMTSDQLAKYGLAADEVERHVPKERVVLTAADVGVLHVRSAIDEAGTQDKA